MDMEYINGKMVIDTKGHGLSVLSMEKELTFSQMVICTLVTMFKENHKVKVYINGKMVVYIVESSKKVLNMEKENGEKLLIIQNVTDLKVNI